jgi:rod shape determining protein RodA
MATVKRFSNLDLGLIALLAVLSTLGLLTLWSASHGPDGEVASFASKQVIWLVIGFAAMYGISRLDYRHLQNHAWIIYAVLLALLTAVMVLGKASMGAQRWLSLGPVKLQPSEFMKIGIAVIMAHYYSAEAKLPPYGIASLVKPAAITLFPALLVLVQPDLGTAMLIICVAGAVTVFQGISRRVTLTALVAVPLGAPLFWSILKDYQKNRILTFLSPERDPMGAGYHIIQSKIAIGSGQIFGKGYLNGTQSHLRFLPERHTDFIFAVFAEEWGLLGCLVILAFFATLILWGLDIAAKSRDTFGRLLAVGLTSILFAHIVVNTGMVMGLLPVVGVPLPLFSYGGSSVLTTCLVAGILLSIRRKRFAA